MELAKCFHSHQKAKAHLNPKRMTHSMDPKASISLSIRHAGLSMIRSDIVSEWDFYSS